MHDMSLGGPVDVGSYEGPMLEGKPLHSGNCEDGVYGCTMCGHAARQLTDEQLKSIGFSTTSHCDWCKKETHVRDMRGVRPWDEPSCYYQICIACFRKYKEEEAKEFADEGPLY